MTFFHLAVHHLLICVIVYAFTELEKLYDVRVFEARQHESSNRMMSVALKKHSRANRKGKTQ